MAIKDINYKLASSKARVIFQASKTVLIKSNLVGIRLFTMWALKFLIIFQRKLIVLVGIFLEE